MLTVKERKPFVSEQFVARFGAPPLLWTRAPGRVDLMGSHTDYNLGYVMTMTIDRDTWIAARPRADRKVSLYSLNLDGGALFDLDAIDHDTVTPWTNYVRGVALALHQAGCPLRGFDGLIHSTVPFNSGLSSSAALEMAAAVMFQLVGDFAIDPVPMALLGQKAENQFVGVNSGILDQYSSALGQAGSALLLDCRALTSRPVPIASDLQVVICDTRAARNLVGTEYGERRAQCEEGVRRLKAHYPEARALRDLNLAAFEAYEHELPPTIARRCRFIIEENRRVLALAETLPDARPAGDRRRLRGLLDESYCGARDLYEIGAPAMEHMMQVMRSGPGIVGARQAGAGFGGCMIALVDADCIEPFQNHVQRSYMARAGLEPWVYPVQASAGAGPLT